MWAGGEFPSVRGIRGPLLAVVGPAGWPVRDALPGGLPGVLRGPHAALRAGPEPHMAPSSFVFEALYGGTLGTKWGARDRSWVGHIQGSHLPLSNGLEGQVCGALADHH